MVWHSLYRQNTSTLEIHCLEFTPGVWWWYTETASFREEVQRVQEWVGINNEDYPLSAKQIKNMWTQHKWWNWFWETNKTQFEIYPLLWSDLWKIYPTLSMYNWDTAVCVCACDGSSQNLMFVGTLSLLHSFRGGTNGLPESMVTLWDMGSPFYSKWALIQWTHPSSLIATKHKVYQYARRLWHLYSMLQESSSIVFILWDPKANVNVSCDMLCWLLYEISRQRHEHLSWGMILEHSSAAPYSVQQTQGVAAVSLLES